MATLRMLTDMGLHSVRYEMCGRSFASSRAGAPYPLLPRSS